MHNRERSEAEMGEVKQIIIGYLEREGELKKKWLEGRRKIDKTSKKPQLVELHDFLSDEEDGRVAEVETTPPALLINPGEMIYVPENNKTPIASLHFSRCTACVGFSEQGRFMAHLTENDINSLKKLILSIAQQFPETSPLLLIPLADDKRKEKLHPNSQQLTAEYIALLRQKLPKIQIETYPCTDFVPEILEQLEISEGIPETAVIAYHTRVEIVPTKIIRGKLQISSQGTAIK